MGTRAERILDTAAKLFARFGYDKTTVDEIAREAGISKGAVYLDFKGKDALFESLLIREMTRYSEAWLARIEADPNGGTIAGMYKNALYALSENAFVAAMMKQDIRVLGSYLHKPDNIFRDKQHQGMRHEFIKMMQSAGAIRQDVDSKVTAHIMNMLSYGLVAMGDVMDPTEIPPLSDTIEGIADMLERSLAPEGGYDREVGKQIVKQLFEAGRKQMDNRDQG